jgi:cytochrome c oxidase subunit 2
MLGLGPGLLLLEVGCAGPQSTLDPAGRGAEQIADLFWWMACGAGIVWLGVAGLAVHACRRPEGETSRRTVALVLLGGGVAAPAVVLAVALGFGLALLPDLVAPAPSGSLRIAVTGEQWWWRVRYLRPDGDPVVLANEIRLPVGRPVEFLLDSPDVIHSFWIPALGGKVDMIPGRRTRLLLEPTRTGVFRGVCAEYCGASHALMAFDVAVDEPEVFDDWLERQSRPASAARSAQARRGRELFARDGCGACHTVRGTDSDGQIGPDLTHVGSRLGLGAATLRNDVDAFARWLARTDEVKPGVHMPAYRMLPPEDLLALAAYLDGLE